MDLQANGAGSKQPIPQRSVSIGYRARVWGKVIIRSPRHIDMTSVPAPTLHSRWRLAYLGSALVAGSVVACPAEGIWGLSCNPFDEEAVQNLLAMKQRSVSKGLILVAATSETFGEVLQALPVDQQGEVLASWPGPHTWLVPHGGLYPPWVTGNSDEVAIRVTSAPALSALCDAFGGALVSTSANPAGLPPPHTMWELRRYFGSALPALPAAIDPAGKPSTIRRAGDGKVVRG
jgi:L-threonylcarbamoyladenylate synthase